MFRFVTLKEQITEIKNNNRLCHLKEFCCFFLNPLLKPF